MIDAKWIPQKQKHALIGFCNAIFFIFCLPSHADIDKETLSSPSNLKVSGYLESYYVNPRHNNGDLPNYVYSYQQTEQLNINLGLIQAKYSSDAFRGNLGIASGTFMRANYAKESGVLNNLTPYFETGAKLSFTSQDQRWTFAGLVLNGWQRIRRQADNSLPAIGHLISYQSPSGVLINSSSFIGSDTPDHDRKMRYFHHFNIQIPMTEQLQMQLAWDIGAEQREKSSSRYYVWHAPLIQARYQWHPAWSMTARLEAYQDPHEVMIQTVGDRGFRASAFSSNVDFRPNTSVMYRIELKKINVSGDDSYEASHQSHDNLLLTTLIALEF